MEEGAINLSQVELINRSIKQKEREEKIALSAKVKMDLVSLVQNQDMPRSQQAVAQALDLSLKACETKFVQKDESVHLSITLSKDQYAKLSACKELAAHQLLQSRGLEFANVIEFLADRFIQSRTAGPSPRRKALPAICSPEVNSSRKELPVAKNSAPAVTNSISDRKLSALKCREKINKSLTPKTRRQILAEQKCCQYKNHQTQEICGSRFALEVDHKISRWSGGDHSSTNLQVLCAAHNKLKFRKEVQLEFL